MKVVIGTPAYDSKVSIEYLESMLGTISEGAKQGIEFIPKFICGDSIIQSARDRTFILAMEQNPDSMIWIDSDMEWSPELAIRFAKSELDVLAAPCIKRSIRQQYSISFDSDNYTVEDDIMTILGAGTGFLKMSRKAMDYLWESSPIYTSGTEERRSIFEIKLIGDKLYGEDIFVCKKLSEGGFTIHADISQTLNHIGTHKFSGNFKTFLEEFKRVKDKESFELAKELGLV